MTQKTTRDHVDFMLAALKLLRAIQTQPEAAGRLGTMKEVVVLAGKTDEHLTMAIDIGERLMRDMSPEQVG